ncbi:MAG TPA: signal peptidase I [Candidatus Moranbacteria bacterium]|nr:signal peptidase I [Candidatus Moranbacteria bacterium]
MLEKPQEEKNQEYDRYAGVGSFILEIIKIIALAFIIIVPVRVFLFQPFFVQGASMEPNFEDGEYLIINEFGYKKTSVGAEGNDFFTIEPFKDVERQEVIVFRYPLDTRKFFIKRVIGLPGEKIEIKNNQVKIFNDKNPNGFVLDENVYLDKTVKTNGDMTVNLEKDEYFVMGDNRQFSSDSRVWGPIKEKHVIGKVLLRAWPVNKASIF